MTVPVPDQLEFISVADGVTRDFPYPKRFLQADEIRVLLRDANGVDTPQFLGQHFSIAGSSWPNGGSVSFYTTPPSGLSVVRYRATQAKQTVDLENKQRNDAKAVELQLDRTVMAVQDNNRLLNNAAGGLKAEIAARQQGDKLLNGRVDKEIIDRDNGDRAVASLIGKAGVIPDLIFETALALSFAQVSDNVNYVRTGGHANPADGGGTDRYRKSVIEADRPGDLASNDGNVRWGLVQTGEISVMCFGAHPSLSAEDNTAAFLKAAEFLPEGGRLLVGSGRYNLRTLLGLRPINIVGRGQGSTELAFDNSSVSADGVVYSDFLSFETEFGMTNLTVVTVGGHGRDAIVTPSDGIILRPKPVFHHVSFRSENAGSSFSQIYSWRWMFHLGDSFDASIGDIDAYGCYRPELNPNTQFIDGFIRTNPSNGILSLRLNDTTTHNVGNCFEIRRKTYFSMYNCDFARAWRGIYDAPDRVFETNRYAYGEAALDFVIINAQKDCLNLTNRFFTNLVNVAAHRSSDGFDHGLPWYGIRYDDSNACQLTNIEITYPSTMSAFTSVAVGLEIAGGTGLQTHSITLGGALTAAVRCRGRSLDNGSCQSAMFFGVTIHGNMSGVVFDLLEARQTKVFGFSKASGFSYGSFVSFGNAATELSTYFIGTPSDNRIEFDDDFTWTRPSGALNAKHWRWQATDAHLLLATQADNGSAGQNAVIVSRSGVQIVGVEFRGDVIQLGQAGSQHKSRLGYCPEYADNAAALAAGLISGMLYRTGDNVKIVR